MPSTQEPQNTQTLPDLAGLDSRANEDKIGAINELLGIGPEQPTVEPETAPPGEAPEPSLSEALAEVEKPNDGGESQKAAKPPKTLTELAERLDVKVEDLYAMAVPTKAENGEDHTLGSLKDAAEAQIDYAGRELALQERSVQLENDQVKARSELEIILNSLPPDSIKPEVLQRAKAEREAFLDREGARVLDVIPTWEDDQAKRADMAGIGEHMAEYGFDETHVDQVADHRMLRYMRDNYNRKLLVEKALAAVKPVKAATPKAKPRKPAAPVAPVTATPDSALNDQLTAIDQLLQ